MPGHGAGTLKWPQPSRGGCDWPGPAGCHRQRPLTDTRSRVGVDSRTAFSRPQTALIPWGNVATSSSASAPSAIVITTTGTAARIGSRDGWIRVQGMVGSLSNNSLAREAEDARVGLEEGFAHCNSGEEGP